MAGHGWMRQFTFEEITEALSALRDQSARPGDDERLTFLAFCLEHLPRSRGQFLQDLWVAYELRGQTGGYFVDVGASDGVMVVLPSSVSDARIVAEPDGAT